MSLEDPDVRAFATEDPLGFLVPTAQSLLSVLQANQAA